MKRLIFSISTFCLLAALAGGYIYMQEGADNPLVAAHTQDNPHVKKVLDRAQSYIGAHEYLLTKKANPATGRVDVADVLNARQNADKLSESRVEKSGNINWEFLGPNNVGGRTRAIMIDKDNTDRMIVGGVAGGLFVSTNGGLSWEGHPQNTSFSSLAVSAINQAANGHIYVGTGEYIDSGIDFGNGKSGGSKIPGNGVYKSTDGGATFQLLESTIPSISNGSQTADDWLAVQDIETSPINPNTVYASTTKGLQISQDGGMTWAKASGIPANTIAYDVAIASDGTVHAVAESKYYRADDGLNFSDEFTGNTPGKFEISSRNKVLAMSPSDNDYLYIVTITSGGCLRKVWQSKNGGTTWVIIGEGSGVFFDPMSQNGGGSCQGWYDLCVEVDPANKERIVVGGITLWSWSARDSWNQLDGGNFNSPY
ncbi:MAG: WD40/YVTN/BNR-like repeat-containing protein, partial [Chitinophagales bacterium]